MTEADAVAWIRAREDVSREAFATLTAFVAKVVEANQTQSLIAPSTVDAIWGRHIVDSIQLKDIAGSHAGWVDVGSGGGFPGVVLAILGVAVTCVEPRALRAAFLTTVKDDLRLSNMSVEQADVKRMKGAAQVVSARAVAPVTDLLGMTFHLADPATQWILPAGRSATAQIEQARRDWIGTFHVEPSMTDADSGIVVASEVRRRP